MPVSAMPPLVTSHNYTVFEGVLRIKTNLATDLTTDRIEMRANLGWEMITATVLSGTHTSFNE